ncbi:UNVERIFIED_CONTAM: hypothetical protein GTU68_046518 [Idotea baltica]|nr:hypothetical protein [Idotea baltica]
MSRQTIKKIRQTELIDAVVSAVHAHGFAALTVSQIAKQAETSTGSIHYYFGGKDALLEATMRRLLAVLKSVTLERLRGKTDPRDRLAAIVGGNFDEAMLTAQNCSVWTQFWAYAPYIPSLARLQRINKHRVQSNLRAELKHILPEDSVETARSAIQAYMDGVWLHVAQSGEVADPARREADAKQFLELLLRKTA